MITSNMLTGATVFVELQEGEVAVRVQKRRGRRKKIDKEREKVLT